MNMVAEGYYATDLIWDIKNLEGIEMPIVNAIHEVVYQKKSARKIFLNLAENHLS